MFIDWGMFLTELMSNPLLVAVVIVNIGVIIVNGATDAPNAIATVVSTRCMSPNAAILMAAICNFVGLVVITLFSSAVASTIFHMVDFGGDPRLSLIALVAAMVAIIVWGVVTWYFGIPTSESHALIAGLTGAAIALQGGLAGVNGDEWIKVVYGILLSTFMGFGLGWLTAKLLMIGCRRLDRNKTDGFFKWAQIAAGAGVAFMHGAQDGQKFMGVFMLAIMLALGFGQTGDMEIPFWLVVASSLSMGLGTAIGGKRIIKSVGMDMVKMEKYQGFAASFAATICLVASTFGGLPVSTTHTKTTAIMGVGAAKRFKSVNWGIALDMVKAWVLTFPGCGLLGYVVSMVFLAFS